MNNILDGSALLPTPPPSDDQAADLYGKWDTATPEEQAVIKPKLLAYADAKDAASAAQQRAHFEKIFSGTPQSLAATTLKDEPELSSSNTQAETAAGAANMAYVSATTGRSSEELAANWPSIRSGYAMANHNQDVKSDTDLFGLIAQDVARKKASVQAINELPAQAVVHGFQDVVSGRDTSTLDTFSAWKEAHPDVVKDYPETQLHQIYTDLYQKTAQLIAPLAPQAKIIFDSLAQQEGRPDAPTGGQPDINALATQIQDLAPEQKQALYTVAAAYAQQTGQPKGFWTQVAQSIGRSITGSAGSIGLAAQEADINSKLELLNKGNAVIGGDNTIIPKTSLEVMPPDQARNFTAPTDDQKATLTSQLLEQQKKITTVRELNALATQQIDPIKPSSDWMNHTLEAGLYGAASALPLVGASLLQPEVGIPAVGAAIYGQEYDRMRLAYPNVPISQVQGMAALSAAPQAALMELKAGAILGEMPMLGSYLKTLGNPRMNPAIRIIINSAGQTAEQGGLMMAQNAVPMMIDGLSKAAGADMPQYDLGKALEGYADSTPEALFSVLPFALIGAGFATHGDMLRSADITKSKSGLIEAGYSQPEAQRIAQIEDPTERAAEIQKTWSSRTPEDIQSGALIATQRIEADVKNQADPTTPTLRSEDEIVNGQPTGNKIFTVMDEQGNQKIQTTDPEAAVQYYQTATSDAASSQRSHLQELMQFFQGIDQSQGRERTYDITPATVTASDEVSAGQSTEQLQERMAQAGVPQGTPLDQVIIKGKTTPDLSRQVYSDTVQVLDGRADTMVHERLDGEVMAAIHEGNISNDQFLQWAKQTEAATGAKWLPEIPEGSDYSRQQVREAITSIGEAYLTGRIRRIQSVPEGLRGLFQKMLVYFQHVLAKAKVLRAAIDAGKVPQDFHSFLAKSIGLPEEAVVENHSANATAEVTQSLKSEPSYSMGQIETPDKGWFENPHGDKDIGKFSPHVLELTNKEDKPVVLKENIAIKNQASHPEISHEESMAMLQKAISRPDMLILDQPGKKPDNWHFVTVDKRNHAVLVELAEGKDAYEIVNWHYLKDSALAQKIERAGREGGRVLITGNGPRSAGLSDLPASSRLSKALDAAEINSSSFPLTETGGTTSYSLTTKAEQDRLNEALQKHLNRSPDARMEVYQKMRYNLDNIIRRNNAYLVERADAPDANQRYAQMLQSVGELEAVIKSLPMEIRGKIGGYRDILSKSTDQGRTTVLIQRIEMADKALEKLLKDGYDQQLAKALDRSRPKKNTPGEKPKGIGADIQRLFATLKEAKSWTPEEAAAHADKLDAQIEKGELTPAQEAHAQQEAALTGLVSNWQNADSIRRSIAVKAVKNAWEKGYAEHIAKVLQRRESDARKRAALIADVGIEGSKVDRKNKELRDLKLGSKWGIALQNFYSFDQLVHSIFGDKSKEADNMADQQRKAENLKQDRLQTRWHDLSEKFKKMAGSDQKGEELRYNMSQPSIDLDGLHLSENEALAATMMWMQEDGRRHMEGRFNEDGKLVSSWGYKQADIDKIESQLSKEAKMLREYLLKKYEDDWHTLNAVYREQNGVDLPRNKNYSPLTVKPQRVQGNQMVDPVTGVAHNGMSSTPGSLRGRGSSIAEPEFRDALQTYIAHNMQMEHYKAFAKFNSEMSSVLRNRELNNAVEAGSGIEAKSVLGMWLDGFATGGYRDAGANLFINKTMSKMTGRAAQMALVGKIGTILVQASQLGAAITEMPTGAYVTRLAKLMSGNLDWTAAFNSDYIQRRIKELPPIARQAMDGLKSDKPTWRKSAMQKLGTLIGGADGLFTAGTYAMVYDYHLGQAREMGLSGAEAESYARNIAERSTDRMAQPTRAGSKSLYENTSMGNPLARLAFSFASENRKNLALFAYAMAHKSPAEKARAIAFVMVLSGLVGNMIRSAWSDAKDDSDTEPFDTKHWNWKKIAINTVIEPIQGIPILGAAVQQGALGLAGIYTPNSDLISQPAQEAFHAAKHIPDYMHGEFNYEQVMKDADGILHVMGLFNSEMAAFKSMENLAKDAFGIGRNAEKVAAGKK